MTEELLTQAQFAALVGVSAPRINKLVKAGRIPLVDKKIPKDSGLTAWNNREIGFEKAAIAGKKFGGDPRKTKNNGPKNFLDDEDEESNDAQLYGDEWAARFKIARTLEKEEMAQKRKFENEVEQGKYVLKSDVRQEASELASAIKQKLISIAPIIAVTAEGKTALQIQKIAEKYINEALGMLQDMEY